MPTKVCPRCGRETSIVIEGLCPQCYVDTHEVVSMPSRVEIDICKYCGRVRLGNKWVETTGFQNAVESIIHYLFNKSKKHPSFEEYSIEEIRYETLPNWYTRVELLLSARISDWRVSFKKRVDIKLNPTICPVCKTRISGEYDTLLQIRGERRIPEEGEIVEIAFKLGISNQLVDIIRGKKGIDVYFTNTGAARKLAKLIINRYGGKLTTPRYEEVTTTSTGKTRTRKTLVLRIPRREEGSG